jgi:hypothetical protein
MEDAKLAGLAGKNNWKTYPRAMLMARCTGELCRILFPDIIAGLSYTPEEIASIEGVEIEEPAPAMQIEDAVLEEVVAEIIDEIDDERRVEIGSAVKVLAEELVESGIVGDATTPPFEERLEIAESWGGWPLVKGVASMLAIPLKCDKPASFPELAHNEALWVKTAEEMKKRGKW